MMKTSPLTAASLLIATAAGVVLTSCTPPMPPPPPGPRGRNLDAPPRYGVPQEQTRYFEGATMDPGAVEPPNPDAPLTSPDTITVPPPGSTPAPATGTGATPPVTVTPPGPTPPSSSTSPAAPPTSTPPPAPAPAPADYPFATRIPGKPGFVKSPFDPSGQAIDVRDFRSGQKAKCPYTGKIFRVP